VAPHAYTVAVDTNERRVECPEHGSQPATFVCQHIVQSLRDGVPRGFLWPAGTGMERPDAWCVSCDDAVEATGGEWTDESEAEAGVTLLCAACYDRAKEMNKE
jgi:hypothetical protein